MIVVCENDGYYRIMDKYATVSKDGESINVYAYSEKYKEMQFTEVTDALEFLVKEDELYAGNRYDSKAA